MKKIFSFLLLTFLLSIGVNAWGTTSYEELFTIKSSDVVTNSAYAAYNTSVSTRDFVITFGGNNKSVGTNSNNRSKCKLSNYSKYAVSPVTTTSIASAFACKTSISDVTKISYTFNGGSNQTNTNVYILYSSDNTTFSQVTLKSGTQGAAISSGTAYEFDAKTGYFALLFEATNSDGNWRIDDVDVTFYKEATGGSDPSISASNVDIAQDATNGSIAYTLNNATGNVSAATTSDWLTLDDEHITASAVPFTCSANTGAQRTATVTLSFTGATDKVVTITQAAKTVATPEFNLEGNKRYWQGTEITLTSAGNTIYYEMTTDGSAPSTPTNASTEYTAPIVLGSGTTKITAIAYDTYGNTSSTTTRTYTGVAPATLPFSWNEKSTTTTGVICSTGVGTYNSSPYLKISDTDQNVILKFNEVPGELKFDIKGNDFSGGTFKVQTSVDGETYSDLATYTELGSKQSESFNLAGNVRYVKWIYTYKSSGNVALGNFILTKTNTITLAEACTDGSKYYGTFSLGKAFVVPEGLTVSTVGVSGGKLTITDYSTGDVVKANTGVLVSSTSFGTKTVTVSGETGVENDGNMLYPGGVTAEEMADAHPSCKYYKLSLNSTGTENSAGFYWGADNGVAFASSEGKAYLAVPTSEGTPAPSAFRFVEEENNATNIEATEGNEKVVKFIENGQLLILKNGQVYDVTGRMVK